MVRYLHFTDSAGAKAIRRSGKLLSSSFVSGVYAVEEGALYLPSVQRSGIGRPSSRDTCVVFTTARKPDVYRPEEVIWHADEIPVRVVEVLPADRAVSKYLYDDSNASEASRDMEDRLDYLDLTRSPLMRPLMTAFNLQGTSGVRVYVHLESIFRGGQYRIALSVSWPLGETYEIPKGSRISRGLRPYLEDTLGVQFSSFEFEDYSLIDTSQDDSIFDDSSMLYTGHFRFEVDLTKKIARAPQELGLPGGPCHIIRDIEEENLSPEIKEMLISDIEKGKDLSNSEADLLYPQMRLQSKSRLFQSVLLTSHAQYRMNLRGVIVPEIQGAFEEFNKWYQARSRNPDKLKPDQRKLLSDLSQGEAVRFDAKRSGLTIVFSIDARRREARLVSCWWTGVKNPPKPKPGQCDFVPYLDKSREFERPAILGNKQTRRIASIVATRVWVERYGLQ